MKRICISRDDRYHEAWPSICRLSNGNLICSYSEADVHGGGSYPSACVRFSADGGDSWSDPIVVDSLMDGPSTGYFMARSVVTLPDDSLLLGCDWYDRTFTPPPGAEHNWSMDPKNGFYSEVWLYRSHDYGITWTGPERTGRLGWSMNLGVLSDGRVYISGAHYNSIGDRATQDVYFSEDLGRTWSDVVSVVDDPEWGFAEGDIVEFDGGNLVMYLRCESGKIPGSCGYKAISNDGGLSWHGPYAAGKWPVVGRVNAGRLSTGDALVVHRIGGFAQQRMFGFFTETEEQALSTVEQSKVLIADPPAGDKWGIIDNDISPYADYGYGDWIELPDGDIYAVNYIVDDAPKNRPQIRGYRIERGEIDSPRRSVAIRPPETQWKRGKLVLQNGWVRQSPDHWRTKTVGSSHEDNLGNYVVISGDRSPGSKEYITATRNIGGGAEELRLDVGPYDINVHSLRVELVHSGRQKYCMFCVLDASAEKIVELRSDFVRENLWACDLLRNVYVSSISCSSEETEWWRTYLDFNENVVNISTRPEKDDASTDETVMSDPLPWASVPFKSIDAFAIRDTVNADLNYNSHVENVVAALQLVLGEEGDFRIRSISFTES